MTIHRFEYIGRADGGLRETLTVDGNDIGNITTGLDVRMRPGDLTKITLHCFPGDGISVKDASAQIEVDPATAAALRLLGWTPPGGCNGSCEGDVT